MYAFYCFGRHLQLRKVLNIYYLYNYIITSYRMNKRGFDCALSLANARSLWADSLPLAPFFSLFLLILPRLLTYFFLFFLVPHQVSNQLPLVYLSATSPSSTPLHHEIQLRITPPKIIFILPESFAFPKFASQFAYSCV